MIRILAMALAIKLASTPAAADPDRLSILLGSAHLGGSGFDGRNPGVALTWEDVGGLDLSLAVYRNSYGRGSVAVTAGLPVIGWAEGEASLFLGAALYPEDGRQFRVHVGDVVPVGGLQLRLRNFFFQVLPSDGRAVDAVVSMGVTFDLD